jgi:hypothetical protein
LWLALPRKGFFYFDISQSLKEIKMEEEEELDVNEPTLEERLEAAATESSIVAEVDDMTDEEVLEELEELETDEGGEENRIPQSRFNEVNNALHEIRESEAEMRDQLAESQDKLVRMQDLLESRDGDVQTLNEIKSFVNDPAMKDHVLAIDARLKGIDQAVDEGKLDPEDALQATREMFEDAQDELRDTQADLQADQLISKADTIAERLLQALPEEYNDEDLAVINDLFTEKVDWDAAVEHPDHLAEILTEGFQETIDRYGMPRGALFDTDEVDLLTEDYEPIDDQTPEEELHELMDLPWGEIRETEFEDGTVAIDPEMSDDDFNKVMAQAIRLAHQKE